MTPRRHPQRARPVAVGPRVLESQLGAWARGIEALAGSSDARALGARPGVRVELFQIVIERTDWISCTRLLTGGTVAVAKPPNLRGDIAARTAFGGQENQVILPAYSAGSPLFAEWVPGGALGVQVPGGNFTLIYWQDQNVDARTWAEDT